MTRPEPLVPPARCQHCGRTWDGPPGDATPAEIRARMVEVALELAGHLRGEHGNEHDALVLERHVLDLGR